MFEKEEKWGAIQDEARWDTININRKEGKNWNHEQVEVDLVLEELEGKCLFGWVGGTPPPLPSMGWVSAW